MSSSDPTISWVPLDMFYVLYPKGDFIGHILAYVSLTPFAIVVAFVTLILFLRELHVIFFFAGQLANEVFNLFLKKLMHESRPVQVVGMAHSNKSSGMPSQHSQFMAFFTVYSTLFILFRLNPRLYSSSHKLFLISLLFTLLSFVVYSRIYLLYHFAYQCYVGVLIGSFSATIWFTVVNCHLENSLFLWLLNLNITQQFGLCNSYHTVLIEDEDEQSSNDKRSKSD